MTHLLQLRFDPTSDAGAKAWFLSGDCADRWIEELAEAGLAIPDTRLFIVPRSLEDPSPAGALVVPPANFKGAAPAGLPCQLIAGRLFIPTGARLHPPLSDAEARALCTNAVNFFHPLFGLSAFEEKDHVPIWNLLEAPEDRDTAWNAARPGSPPLPELSRIVLTQPPTIQDIFGGAEKEIGSEPIVDLPPAPDEPKDAPLQNTGRNLKKLLAEGVAGAMKHVPHTGSERNWLNNLEDWANKQLHGLGQQLEHLRNKELHRLLSMLESDPEEGLRHAIPMNGFAHRGLASPTAKLGSRNPNFDLTRLGGGGAADFWNVPGDIQEQLRRRYREMADREARLGRFRRAAYIYAELLGDLVSAAKVLKQGRHFREAALLYEEHLKNPIEAAHCLAEGGLLEEAFERYSKLERWMDAADVAERMGNRALAEGALRRAVSEQIRMEFYLGAAAILEDRLKAPDEALEVLLQAWPGSKQAVACAGAAFRLLARLGRHEAAMDLVNRVGTSPSSRMTPPILKALFEAARDYPHQPVRHRAADLSRVLIARELSRPALPSTEAQNLMEALARLAPKDRLLVRDTNRFLSRLRVSELDLIRKAPPPPTQSKQKIKCVRRIELPRQIDWFLLRRSGPYFYVVGATPKHLTVMRGSFLAPDLQSLSWPCNGELAKNNLIFEPANTEPDRIELAVIGGERFEEKLFPRTDLFDRDLCFIGAPWLNPQETALSFGDNARWTAHIAAGRAIMSCHDGTGTLRNTLDLTADLLEGATVDSESRLLIAAVRSGVAVAIGNRLVITDASGLPARIDLPGQAKALVATLPNTRAGVAVTLDHGAIMQWCGAANPMELDRDAPNPMAAFLHGGGIVLVSTHGAAILQMNAAGVSGVSRLDLPTAKIRSVIAENARGHFATLAGNEITVFTTQL